ncbi:isochorismatase hydrolase [Colletotrichum karsti]|uniref:Isochorismatase hydrolase n=1 Tax=Colletotrichum karsti TaxID=1095194 RepID=A0A9P6I4S7_9PEZI|nr:isochorismatase hydrolase [Colletotrichum karsti]KAF9875021.1 isochorismatase hydrolase [Colletotrichum karsti]
MSFASRTALVLMDPYNDFLHPEGILTPRLTDLEEKQTVENIRAAVSAARSQDIPIYYGLHQQYTENSFNGWKHMTPNNVKQNGLKFFQEGSWGAQILDGLEPDLAKGDVVASKHWNSE